jgi:hypothetical protein
MAPQQEKVLRELFSRIKDQARMFLESKEQLAPMLLFFAYHATGKEGEIPTIDSIGGMPPEIVNECQSSPEGKQRMMTIVRQMLAKSVPNRFEVVCVHLTEVYARVVNFPPGEKPRSFSEMDLENIPAEDALLITLYYGKSSSHNILKITSLGDDCRTLEDKELDLSAQESIGALVL